MVALLIVGWFGLLVVSYKGAEFALKKMNLW